MDKIYSRPRLPKLFGVNSNKIVRYKKIIIIIFIIIFIAWSTAIKIIEAITPILERQCRVIARSTATKYSNEACNKAMQNLTYDDLCTIEKDEDDRIRLIKMNSVTINKLNSQIGLEVQEKLNNSNTSKFYIKLGTFTGSKILSGRGPNVEIVMCTIGDVTSKIRSEFEETGINQTLHKVCIDINCNVSVLTPFKDVDEVATVEVVLSEAIISGDIPDSYYDLEGMSAEDTMNMMN